MLIEADPPWAFRTYAGRHQVSSPVRGDQPYPVMTLEELKVLPVRQMADKAAHLYLWTINAYLEDTYEIARLWGFRPSTLLTWTKPITGGGLGGCYRLSTEWCLFARRSILTAKTQIGQSHFEWPRQSRHSQKPDAFMDLVESVSPGPYLEMFARRQRLGWDTWGNEAHDHIGMAS